MIRTVHPPISSSVVHPIFIALYLSSLLQSYYLFPSISLLFVFLPPPFLPPFLSSSSSHGLPLFNLLIISSLFPHYSFLPLPVDFSFSFLSSLFSDSCFKLSLSVLRCSLYLSFPSSYLNFPL